MINLSFFSDLMVLPLRALLFLPVIAPGPGRQRIQRMIWNVTSDVNDAIRLLMPLYQHDRSQARMILEELAEKSRDCGHVGLLCDLDFRSSHDEAFVRMWIDRARKDEYANQPMLVYLELLLCDPHIDADRALELSDTILSRGDYPPQVSYTALYNRMLAYISRSELDAAQEIADRVTSISSDTNSLLFQLIMCYARGDDNPDELIRKMDFRDENHRSLVIAQARKAGGKEANRDL
jgi:hypothetical protein